MAYELCKFCLLLQVYCQENHGGGRLFAVVNSPTLDGTRNPLSVLIPCHRVVGAGGKLTGYAGGLDKKAWLLAHEGAAAGGK